MRTLRTLLPASFAVALIAVACAPGGDQGPGGSPGPTGTPGPGPVISAVLPPVGSLHNSITILGTGFSSSLSGNDVRFGGVAAIVQSVSPTVLKVALPASGLALGPEPVTVTAGSVTSAPAGFTLVASGTTIPAAYDGLLDPRKPLYLANGRILVPDKTGVMAVETNGLAHLLAGGLPEGLAMSSSGQVLVFDQHGLFRLDPTSGALDVVQFGPGYLNGSRDPAGNVYLVGFSGAVALLDTNGSYTASWATLPVGTTPIDAQFLGGNLYIAGVGTATGVYKVPAPAGGLATPLVTAGVNQLRSISTDGTTLLAAGNFVIAASSQEAAVTIDPTLGTITPIVSGRFVFINGVAPMQSGYVLSDLDGAVETFSGGILTVKAAGARPTSLVGVGPTLYGARYTSPSIPGWLFRLDPDGVTHLLAQGDFGQLLPGSDPQHILAVRPDSADVVSVNVANGSTANLFAISSAQMTSPLGLAQDSLGNYYVSSPSIGVVWKYSANGTPGPSAFATVAVADHLRTVPGYLFVCQPGAASVTLVNLANQATGTFISPQQGIGFPSDTMSDLTDPTGSTSLVISSSTGQVWRVENSTSFATLFGSAPAARTLAQTTNGMVVLGGDLAPQLVTP